MALHRSLLVSALATVGSSAAAQDPAYFTSAEIAREIDDVARSFPEIAMKVEVSALPGASRTWEGNAIWALKISRNVAVAEDEPAIVIAAQHHARELNTPVVVIGAMQRIASAYGIDPALTGVVDSYELWFVPSVNPDGVDWVWSTDPDWRKNRRDNGGGVFGVDVNRNYPTLWGRCGASTDPRSENYQGPSPASEPEVRTMRAMIAAIRPELYLDIHSSGREVLHTYAPCASRSATIQAFIDTYVHDLRQPMGYGFREPSASGEAPEDHWNTSGALSFLIETGTSFQPPFEAALAEEARVWPGLRRALTGWKPALRGHVRSIFRNEPLEADITFAPNVFEQGEMTVSRAFDGRYGLWLPVGTWQVKWSADGFEDVVRNVTVDALNEAQTLEIAMVPAWQPATLQVTGSHRIGTTTAITYTSPGDAGLPYFVPLSLGASPGTPVGTRRLPLNADALFFASLNAPGILSNNLGVLPASEQVTAAFHIPNAPPFVGLSFHTAGITFESGYPLAIKRWSPATQIVVQQ